MSIDPEIQSLRQRLKSLERWARTVDRAGATAAARKAAEDRFDKMVPAEITDPELRAKSAECFRKAHYTRMALESAKVRKAKAAQRKQGDAA